MKRLAILIINSFLSKYRQVTDIEKKDANNRIEKYCKTLSNLGEYSFSPVPLIDLPHIEAQTEILKQYSKYSTTPDKDARSCLLVYFHGHAIDRDGDLLLRFADSNPDTTGTFIPFKFISEKVFEYGINNAIFILDCCYAGAVQRVVKKISATSDYAFLCSAIPTQKANIQKEISPFGLFSHFIFDGFQDPLAIDQKTNSLTVSSLFYYAKSKLSDPELTFNQKLNVEQTPKIYDGGLSNFCLNVTKTKKFMDSRYNPKAPIKSYYYKFGWILTTINQNRRISRDDLYSIVVSNQTPSFLTPVKGSVGRTQPIISTTFDTYVNGLIILGAIEENSDILQLTVIGNNMLSTNKKDYNDILLGLIENNLKNYDLTLEGLEAIIKQRMSARRITTGSMIFRDIRAMRNVPLLNSSWFTILLELLSYSGYIRLSTQRTFYPY